jgi:hypothetical protein
MHQSFESDPNVTLESASQCSKQYWQILSAESGMEIAESDVQERNARFSTDKSSE